MIGELDLAAVDLDSAEQLAPSYGVFEFPPKPARESGPPRPVGPRTGLVLHGSDLRSDPEAGVAAHAAVPAY